jgi:hypothetical protein
VKKARKMTQLSISFLPYGSTEAEWQAFQCILMCLPYVKRVWAHCKQPFCG